MSKDSNLEFKIKSFIIYLLSSLNPLYNGCCTMHIMFVYMYMYIIELNKYAFNFMLEN